MALFVLIILIFNNCFTILFGSENRNKFLEIKPTSLTGGQNVGFYKVESTLNLTCVFKNESYLPNINLEWIVPIRASNRQNRLISNFSNALTLTIENLQENDSGDYKCAAVHNGIPYFKVENTIRINVKNKKKECTDAMFQCSAGICIPKRYTCDGQNDCFNGEDESLSHCGTGNPCINKLRCPDNRCIPFTWCCELHRDPNCTAKVKPECCTHEKLSADFENDFGYQYEQQKFNDMGFLQTTLYTVIGCAMAFMFIVTIIVIAICRVHVRRTLLSRCPASNRNLTFSRRSNVQGDQLNGLSFYDLDLYLSRSGINGNDLMSVNPLLVTYNINNGVHFVGRPVDPPPYCEIITSPPKEGPPPPYISHENLNQVKCNENPKQEEEEEVEPESRVEVLETDADFTESDALLCATNETASSKISCNAIDIGLPEENVTSIETINEVEIYQGKSCQINPERSVETTLNNDSSHNETSTAGETLTNSKINVVILNDGHTVVGNSNECKVQHGESSSYVRSSEKNISEVAVKKFLDVNSVENAECEMTTNGFSKSHFKKF